MRNLKRALSLALACVMLLGMMATGAGAASTSFTDFDKIVNQEAAEVTSGLGIFDGYTDGSFGPGNVVTRAEMAVIICKLLNGSDVDPGNFAGISKFNDVPAWAEGYVNYCASMNIIVGVGEGKFNPSATVTTVEAATMLLKALGYYTEEDQLAADWKTVVTGRATSMHLYGELALGVDEGLTRDNVAELVFNTLFAQRVAYDDNRHLYVKNTNRDVVVTNGTQDYLNTFAENTFGMWVVDGLVTANSYTDDDLSETVNNGNRTNVVFDAAAAQDYPATVYQGSTGSEYPFEYTTGLDMIGHAARVYYKMERNAPVVYAIADRATKVEYITYDSNTTNLSDAANEAGFRRNTIGKIDRDDYKVNYDWDVTVGVLRQDNDANNDVDLTGGNKWDKNDPAKTLLVISNSTDYAVDYVIVLDQYLDTVKRVTTKDDVTEYDLTTVDGVDQNILHGDAAQGDYVIVTDIGKQGDMLNFAPAERVSANITKITGKSDDVATVKSIVADGTTYAGSPVYDYRPQNSQLDDTTDFEDIATIGDATLLLDAQGKCIGLAEPETINNYAYAAQFGVWHTGGSLNTEYKLTVKLYFVDGTEGVYLVNTKDSKTTNTFLDLDMGDSDASAKAIAHKLNGGSGNDGTNKDYNPLKTYNPAIDVDSNGMVQLNGVGNADTNDVSGLGVYKVSVRADDTVVLQALGGQDAIDKTILNGPTYQTKLDDETKLISGHSTFVKGDGTNKYLGSKVLFQDNKTVYFYVSGKYDDDLSVGAKVGVNEAVGITNSSLKESKDKDNNSEADVFVQILTKGDGGRKNESQRELVEAVLIWGYDLGSNDTLYFYRQNSYDIQHKDSASSRAGEKLYTITYHMYTADGEPYEATFDNGGAYYDMDTAKDTVANHPTGYYTLGSKDIEEKWYSKGDNTIWYVKNNKVNGTGSGTVNGSADGAKSVYVIDATARHDSYVDNLYTDIEQVGGIIPNSAKVVSTVDNCNFDTINEIARACDNGALVKISYCYSTDDYKVKTVFITEYKKEGGAAVNAGEKLWSNYEAPWLYVFNDISNGDNFADVANSAKTALEKAGFTVNAMEATSFQVGASAGDGPYWTMLATTNGSTTVQRLTNGPSGLYYGVDGYNYYRGIVKNTVRVQINGNLYGYCVPGTYDNISNSTVEAGNQYDVEINSRQNGGEWEFVPAPVSSAAAGQKGIAYTLTDAMIRYTVNFKSAQASGDVVIDAENVTGDGIDPKDVYTGAFSEAGDKTPGWWTAEITADITGRALADGTFTENTVYKFDFESESGLAYSVLGVGDGSGTIKVRVYLDAETVSVVHELKLVKIWEAWHPTESDPMPTAPSGAAADESPLQNVPTKAEDINEDGTVKEEDVTEPGEVGGVTLSGAPTGDLEAGTAPAAVTVAANDTLDSEKSSAVWESGTPVAGGTFKLTVTLTAAAEHTFGANFKAPAAGSGVAGEVQLNEDKTVATIVYTFHVAEEDDTKTDATVKAVETGGTWKLYAYYGEETTVTLGKQDIIDAINATRGADESKAVDVERADASATTGNYVSGTWDDGMKFTISGSANESSTQPGKLYKLTFPNNVTKYVEASGTLSGMPANTAYIISTKINAAYNAGSSSADLIVVDGSGNAAMYSTLADAAYVEALQLGKVFDGVTTAVNADVFAIYQGKSVKLTKEASLGNGSGDYFVKGSTLGIQLTVAALANKNVTVTVNGAAHEAVADASGKIPEFETAAITEGKGGDGRVDIVVTGVALYTVTLNGETLAEDAAVNDEIEIPAAMVPEGATFICYKDADHTVNTTNTVTVTTGWGNTYTYKVVAANANTGVTDKNVIELATVYKITASGFSGTLGTLYKGYDAATKELTDAISTNTGVLAKPGEEAAVYLQAENKNAALGLKDGATGLAMTQIQAPGINQKGIWKIVMTGDLASTNVEVKAQLPAATDDTTFATITLDKAIFGGAGGTTTEMEVTCVPKNTDLNMDDVEIKWLDADADSNGMSKTIGADTSEDTITISKSAGSTNGFKIKFVSSMNATGTTGSTKFGTIQITLKQGDITLTTKMDVVSAT